MSARRGFSVGWRFVAFAPAAALLSMPVFLSLPSVAQASRSRNELRPAAAFNTATPQPVDAATPGASKALLRGRRGEVSLNSLTIDAAVQSTGEAIGLHRVRDVSGPLASEFDQLRTIATNVWRATSRLERGDRVAAEPLLESLESTYRGHKGPTAAAVFEGLLLCRLARSAQNAAVSAWLSWVRTGEIGQGRSIPQATVDRYQLQTDTLLVPALPPILFDSPALRASLGDWKPDEAVLEKLRTTGPSRFAEVPIQDRLAALYWLVATFEITSVPSTGPVSTALRYEASEPDDLTLDVVASRIGTPDQRARARDRLTLRLSSDRTPWVEAWCRVALGRSLLLEADRALRTRGVLQLLMLASRGGEVDPYLTGLALAEASIALRREGDTRGSRTLHTELRERFPGHPALSWSPLAQALAEDADETTHSPPTSLSGSVDGLSTDATARAPNGTTDQLDDSEPTPSQPAEMNQNPDGESNP